MSGNDFINCPICDYENHVSSADGKVIDCKDCGAPIFNAKRPASELDVKEYQNRLRAWGYEHQNITKKQVKAHSERNKARKQIREQEASAKQELTKLKTDLELWKDKYKTLQDEKDAQEAEQSERAEALRKLQAELESLQRSLQIQQQENEQLRKQYDGMRSGMRSLNQDIETFRKRSDDFIEQAIKDTTEHWQKLRQIKIEKDAEVVAKMGQLLSASNERGTGDRSSLNETMSQPKASQPRPDTSGNPEGETSPQAAIEIEMDEPTSISAPEVNDTPLAQFSPAPEEGGLKPAWLEAYNALASKPDIQRFKQTYNPERLMVPTQMLEQQWTAMDEAVLLAPVEGAGSSYWLITDQSGVGFLVIDRDRFFFNGTNYKTITLCYNFNDHTEDNLKHFKSNKYDLNTYKIKYPAQVISTEQDQQWQLSCRGRIMFKKKPDIE